jgi:transcriptional regulator with PAS, ATPase and Fis domain
VTFGLGNRRSKIVTIVKTKTYKNSKPALTNQLTKKIQKRAKIRLKAYLMIWLKSWRLGLNCRSISSLQSKHWSRYIKSKMGRNTNRQLIRLMAQEMNDEKRNHFESLEEAGQYTELQKHYAFELISKYGIRATAKILGVPRRTLQRWCRQHRIFVKRCPNWVYEWAERRRRRRLFWQRRGYFYW